MVAFEFVPIKFLREMVMKAEEIKDIFTNEWKELTSQVNLIRWFSYWKKTL